MKPGATLGLSHGFLLGVMKNDGVDFRKDINVVLVAPKVPPAPPSLAAAAAAAQQLVGMCAHLACNCLHCLGFCSGLLPPSHTAPTVCTRAPLKPANTLAVYSNAAVNMLQQTSCP